MVEPGHAGIHVDIIIIHVKNEGFISEYGNST